tara:strand:- start:1099 stop:1365 length:267 start_codon:yes stop_codon:yes gene_type:complete
MNNLKTKKLIRPLNFANHTSGIEVDAKSNILVINEFMREGTDSTVENTAINLFLNASGVVPRYVGSKNDKHYFTFNSKADRNLYMETA